jgi:hypothetical protein
MAVVKFRVTLGQKTVRPVEGVDEAVNDTLAAKPFIPFAMIVSLPAEPAAKAMLIELRVRPKSGGGVTARNATTKWYSAPLRPFTTKA